MAIHEAFRALEALLEERRLAEGATARQRYDQDEERARRLLAVAVPYYWAEEQCSLLDTIAPTLPEHWKPLREACESQGGFFFFAKPLELLPEGAMTGRHVAPVLMWRLTDLGIESMLYTLDVAKREEGIQVTFFWPWQVTLSEAHAIMVDAHQRLEEKTIIDRDFLAMHLRGLQVMAAAFAFLEQRILVVHQARAPRAVRRRLPAGTTEDIVHIVTLRRQVRVGDTGEKEPQKVEWSCQWIVRGHWRDQWFPKTQTHRPIWILPYGKGPEAKPLKMPGTKLFAVVR